MDKYKQVVENSVAFKLIDKNAQSQLICSVDPIGLSLIARYFIAAATGKVNSPDICFLPNGEKVLTADIDQLVSSSLTTPLELDYKYYVIQYAQTMTDAAANKLLKTLEEPPDCVKILILCSNERSVLPTIRSRCRLIHHGGFSYTQLDELVDRFYASSPNAYLAKELHLGSISRLEKTVNGEYNQVLDTVFDVLLRMRSSSQICTHAAQIIKQKDSISDIIDIFELAFRDIMMLQLGGDIHLKHRLSDLTRLTDFYDETVCVRLQPMFLHTRTRLERYANTNSLVDEFLFMLLETRSKSKKVLTNKG